MDNALLFTVSPDTPAAVSMCVTQRRFRKATESMGVIFPPSRSLVGPNSPQAMAMAVTQQWLKQACINKGIPV